MTDSPLKDLGIAAFMWILVIADAIRKRGINNYDVLGSIAADAGDWSPVGRTIGSFFLLGLLIWAVVSPIRLIPRRAITPP